MKRSSRRTQSNTTGRRLKKQPKLKRVHAAAPALRPRMAMPKATSEAARRRRRSSKQRLQLALPTALLKRVAFSARWLSLGLLAVVVYALITIGSYEAFYLTRIPVEGVFSIEAEEIVAASGLAGEHIFAASPKQAAEAITTVPGIIGATVEVSWPNQVVITVQEDSPIAVWEDPDGRFWINEQGLLIPARLDIPGLYTIQSTSANAVIGREYASIEAAADDVAATAVVSDTESDTAGDVTAISTTPIASLGAIPDDILSGALQLSTLLPERTSIVYDPRHGLTYTDTRGWDVYLGTGTDIEQKLVVYEAIISQLEEQSLVPEYVSVSNQEKPFFFAYEDIQGN